MNKILGIHAGLSDPSSSEKLISSILEKVEQKLGNDTFVFEVVSLRNYATELLNSLLTGFNSSGVELLMNKVSQASGLVFVAPVMSAGVSSLFKMFIDVLPENILKNKSVLLGSTAGTKRHSLVIDYGMKPVIDYHHANIISYSVFAATEDWGNFSELSQRIDKAGEEFANVLNNSNNNSSETYKDRSIIFESDDKDINDELFNGKTFHDLLNNNDN